MKYFVSNLINSVSYKFCTASTHRVRVEGTMTQIVFLCDKDIDMIMF